MGINIDGSVAVGFSGDSTTGFSTNGSSAGGSLIGETIFVMVTDGDDSVITGGLEVDESIFVMDMLEVDCKLPEITGFTIVEEGLRCPTTLDLIIAPVG